MIAEEIPIKDRGNIYSKGDYVQFNRPVGAPTNGFVMWFSENGNVQISDNGYFTCQNWVIQESDIIQKKTPPYPFPTDAQRSANYNFLRFS